MTRSLRRRYSSVRLGGQGSAEPLEIGAKAMEAAKSLEAQPRGTPRRMGRGTYRGWRRELGRPSPARWPAEFAAGAWRPITDDLGKWIASRVGVGGGHSTG